MLRRQLTAIDVSKWEKTVSFIETHLPCYPLDPGRNLELNRLGQIRFSNDHLRLYRRRNTDERMKRGIYPMFDL